ncbi:MAG: M48 family metallopeptidase [Sphingomonadales bacterium]|nr:M48 family metallopeptidase [Sphingomonadales bacterium]
MLDWLRRAPGEEPTVLVGERPLPLVVRRLPQARRMTLRLSPDGSEVRVSMPRWGRTAEALAFARSRADWLAGQLAALPQAQPPVPGGTLAFRGEQLAIMHDPAAPRRVRLEGGALLVGGPAESVPMRLRRWLDGEARRLIAEDLAHYCARANRPVPRLSLANARRRWGSCSGRGEIRINWRLVMAPDAVRRSVVAHEVAHLVHFDHSPRFHALLAELFEGDVAAANRWLKREGQGLYGVFG